MFGLFRENANIYHLRFSIKDRDVSASYDLYTHLLFQPHRKEQ